MRRTHFKKVLFLQGASLAFCDTERFIDATVRFMEIYTPQVRKRISFAPFDTKPDHLTKTGSGQTQGKALQKWMRFLTEGRSDACRALRQVLEWRWRRRSQLCRKRREKVTHFLHVGDGSGRAG
jgi:hypothetical protein